MPAWSLAIVAVGCVLLGAAVAAIVAFIIFKMYAVTYLLYWAALPKFFLTVSARCFTPVLDERCPVKESVFLNTLQQFVVILSVLYFFNNSIYVKFTYLIELNVSL